MRAFILALILAATPAHAGTVVALFIRQDTGEIAMLVIPDNDSELDDPAYLPKPGMDRVLMPLDQFRALGPDDLSRLAKLQEGIAP